MGKRRGKRRGGGTHTVISLPQWLQSRLPIGTYPGTVPIIGGENEGPGRGDKGVRQGRDTDIDVEEMADAAAREKKR